GGGGDTVHPGHPYVHQHHIGSQGAGLGECDRSVGRLAHHVDIAGGVQDHAQPGPDRRVIVGEEHPDHSGSPTGSAVAVNGSRACTHQHPDSGPDRKVPLSAVARSRIFARPRGSTPVSRAAGAASSAGSALHTVRTSVPVSVCTSISTSCPGACFIALVTASWTIRYAA